jgi:putative ABC transport system substrate-binding protein
MKLKNTWPLVIALLLALLVVGCQESKEKVYRVGLLSGVNTFNTAIDGFKAKMTELGYTEGENITYDYQEAGGDEEQMKQIAQQFVADEVDLIFTTTTGAAKAAQAATSGTDVAIVFSIVTDPVGNGLVDSISQPGGNVTGINRPPTAYLGKRVEYLLSMAPRVQRLGIFYDPDYAPAQSSVPAVRQAALALGIELLEVEIKSTEDFVAALQDNVDLDAIQMMPDLVNNNSVSEVLAFANEHKLPVVGHTLGQVKQGALFSYADNSSETGHMAAVQADKILQGAQAGDLPVETAELFLTINQAAAEAIGLEIPEPVLRQADEIIR